MHGAAAGIIATFSSYHSAECNIIVFKVNNDKSIDDNVLVEDLFVLWVFLCFSLAGAQLAAGRYDPGGTTVISTVCKLPK